MFWKYNFGSSAQIETLLQKDDVTLHELMDEEELLQECKAQNRKLIDFLTRAEVLDEMVYLVVNEPANDGELRSRFKYANLAAELLTSDVPAIIDKLVASSNLLDVLYKFLENAKPLNPLLASFFSKVLGMLVQRRSEQNWYSYQFTCFQVLDFLKSKGDFVDLAVRHVGTSAIMDLLLKLICNVEEDEIRQSVHQWLNESHLVERLVEKLSTDSDPEEHSSADNLLCEISTSCREVSSDNTKINPLLLSLESEETINKLLDLLLHEERNESSLSHVINVLLTLLSPKTSQLIQILPMQQHQPQPQMQPQQLQQQQQGLQQSSSVESSDSDASESQKNIVARTIAKRLPNLHNILLHPPKKGLLLTTYGQEVEPLGSTRLQVVTLVAALVAANDPIVHNALYELNTIEYLLDLFFKFMLNNFLHTQVELCLTAILTKAPAATSPPGDAEHRLLTQLFTQGRIIERVVAAYEETNDSPEGKQIHNLKGYMGHLRHLANTIVQQAEFGPNEHRIKQLIQDLPGDKATQWDEFVSNCLAEVNRKNEITPLPGFKEMDMDVIGEFRYADEEFKDPDDNLSGPLQRLTTQALAISAGGGGALQSGIDGGGEGGVGEDLSLFEEMCARRCAEFHEMDDIWNDKEKEITFSQETSVPESTKDKEGCSSSDEEEEEEEEEEDGAVKSSETKMDVDDWAEVFDRRSSTDKDAENERPNPWESAPVSDTSDNTGWADFGTFSSGPANNAFGGPFPKAAATPAFAAEFASNFLNSSQENSSDAVFGDTTSNPESFKGDFSNVDFDAAFGNNCDDKKNAVDTVGDAPNSEVNAAEPGDKETQGEVKEEEDLMDNFNFLSSRGLLKSNESAESQKEESANASQSDTVMESQQNSESSSELQS